MLFHCIKATAIWGLLQLKFKEKIVNFILEKFNDIYDFDYKIRCLNYLTQLESFTDVKKLAMMMKEDTMEGSSERRAVLDALKENREREKSYIENHPDYQATEFDDDDEDSVDEPSKGTSRKKKQSKKEKTGATPPEPGAGDDISPGKGGGTADVPAVDDASAVVIEHPEKNDGEGVDGTGTDSDAGDAGNAGDSGDAGDDLEEDLEEDLKEALEEDREDG